MVNPAVRTVKKIKHVTWLAGRRLNPIVTQTVDAVIRRAHRWNPYEYSAERYPHTFLASTTSTLVPGDVSRRVFCAWTGNNPMPAPRVRALESIRETLRDQEVVLITPENLGDWIVESDPLPAAYWHLSAVHRSDYLRVYIAHHYGGGWTDIKPLQHPWVDAFDMLERDPEAWLAGYSEVSHAAMADCGQILNRDLKLHFPALVGSCAYICRPHSPFTDEWLREVKARLAYFAVALREIPGEIRGQSIRYPVPYLGVFSAVYHPLQLKYLPHVRKCENLQPDFDADFRGVEEAAQR